MTLECAVVEFYFLGWLQAYLGKALVAVAQNPCCVAFELFLEPFADALVKSEQVIGSDAFAIGRVGDDDSFLLGLGKLFEGSDVQDDVLAK